MRKILHIEDNDVSRDLVRLYLSDAGYQLYEADDGQRGIELAQKEKPQLILLDLHMPQMTGFEVIAELKTFLPETTTVIALTADANAKIYQECLDSGFKGYLTKPIIRQELVSFIRHYFND